MTKEILIGIVIAVASAYLIQLFGIGNSKVIHIKEDRKVTKIWKIFIIIGAASFFGGALYGLAWATTNGFGSPKAATGISLAIVGLFVLGLGKFGTWWNRHW